MTNKRGAKLLEAKNNKPLSDEELIKKWEDSGMIDYTTKEMKTLIVKNLEKAEKFLNIKEGDDPVDIFIFPLVVRMTKIHITFDVIKTIKDFIKKFNDNKLIIYQNTEQNTEQDGESDFLISYVEDYAKNLK